MVAVRDDAGPGAVRARLLAVTGGLALLLPASCRETSLLVDRPIDAGALTDAKVPKDASREAASDTDAGLSCGGIDGWTAVQPFTRTCKIAVAEPSLWPSLRPTVAPCNNGQAKCTELVLERMSDGRPAQFRSYPMESEASGFVLDIDDPRVGTCRRSLYLQPEGASLAVRGGVTVDRTPTCAPVHVGGNGKSVLTLNRRPDEGLAPAVALSAWGATAREFTVDVTAAFPLGYRSGSTLFPYVASTGTYDVVDEPTKRLVKTTAPPQVINQFLPDLSVAGELWGTAGYGQFGKSETWRLDATGAWSALIQRKGVERGDAARRVCCRLLRVARRAWFVGDRRRTVPYRSAAGERTCVAPRLRDVLSCRLGTARKCLAETAVYRRVLGFSLRANGAGEFPPGSSL